MKRTEYICSWERAISNEKNRIKNFWTRASLFDKSAIG